MAPLFSHKNETTTASEILEDALNQLINATTTASPRLNNCTEGPSEASDDVTTSTLVILPKEIIVVLIMLTLWIYSIILTVRAWKQFLKD